MGSRGGEAFEHVVFPFAYNTPGLVIPASGPAGVKVTNLNPGDVILGDKANGAWLSFISVKTSFVGTFASFLGITTTPDRGDLPGTPVPGALAQAGLTLADSARDSTGTLVALQDNSPIFNPAVGPILCQTATSLWAWIDDGGFNNPGCTQGQGELHLFIARA